MTRCATKEPAEPALRGSDKGRRSRGAAGISVGRCGRSRAWPAASWWATTSPYTAGQTSGQPASWSQNVTASSPGSPATKRTVPS